MRQMPPDVLEEYNSINSRCIRLVFLLMLPLILRAYHKGMKEYQNEIA